MTVTYTAQVASAKLGNFLRLLFRWKGSIYKLVWKEFLIFLAAFYTLNFVYRFAFNDVQKKTFEQLSSYCDKYNDLIPVAFILGFYVSLVIGRWWGQIETIPFPAKMAMFVTANVHGFDERGRLMRRTLLRYLNLAFVMTMSSMSPPVKKRFPTPSHLTDAGFMLPNEEKILEGIPSNANKYFVPLAWATSLVGRARREGRIRDDFAVKTLNDEINEFRGKLAQLLKYDWIQIPLVYTQVVTLAVYTFFLSCLFGRQLSHETDFDVYVPVFTFLQFFFYMGWLKVAESLVCPFGEDDDDFEVNAVIDKNLKVSYLIVDEMHEEHPELIKDQYWDTADFTLPHTEASAATLGSHSKDPFIGSTANLCVTPKQSEFVMGSIQEDDNERLLSTPKAILRRMTSKSSGKSVSNSAIPKMFSRSKASDRDHHHRPLKSISEDDDTPMASPTTAELHQSPFNDPAEERLLSEEDTELNMKTNLKEANKDSGGDVNDNPINDHATEETLFTMDEIDTNYQSDLKGSIKDNVGGMDDNPPNESKQETLVRLEDENIEVESDIKGSSKDVYGASSSDNVSAEGKDSNKPGISISHRKPPGKEERVFPMDGIETTVRSDLKGSTGKESCVPNSYNEPAVFIEMEEQQGVIHS